MTDDTVRRGGEREEEESKTYLAPPLALLNHEQMSCEKQSCVYAFPSAVPVQPAPQRPLQE